ncbi:MAG TPA: HAMP domain-containing sensor histidine kinase [Chloroflexota bacterium]|nr:HAMP domain-containing sensor histidine kinase [Chloroflexota bacterium]HVC82760.1 HAMP domain-containing sensor histidine kinase [Chloroflexota bacterium]
MAVNVTEPTRARRNAERAQQASEELAQLRSEFVAAVSHELRTPLTAVIGYGELLQAHWQRMTEAQRLDKIDRMVLAANRQKHLVEDLLLLTQLEGKLPAPPCSAVALYPMVRQVTREAQGIYPGQHVNLVGSRRLRLRANPQRTLQVLANLIDNAAKYSPAGSEITVEWSVKDDFAVIRVSDNGAGIPESGKAQLFTRFGRVPGSQIRAGRVGTGLGLYLGRQLARAMAGELDLESTGPTGSTFRLSLPVNL